MKQNQASVCLSEKSSCADSMNQSIYLDSVIQIAKLHEQRLQYALEQVSTIFPLTAQKVQTFTQQKIRLLELMTSRVA